MESYEQQENAQAEHNEPPMLTNYGRFDTAAYAMSKAVRKAGYFLIALIAAGIITVLILFAGSNEPISGKEVRVLAVLFLSFVFIGVVALVLVQRAIVAHSAFILRLREQMHKQAKSMDVLAKTLQRRESLDKELIRSLGKLTDELRGNGL